MKPLTVTVPLKVNMITKYTNMISIHCQHYSLLTTVYQQKPPNGQLYITGYVNSLMYMYSRTLVSKYYRATLWNHLIIKAF